MIKQLILQDWKSFRKTTLYFDPLTVVIGTNASGKSNLVDALSFLQKLASGLPLEKIWPDIRGGAEWVTRRSKEHLSTFILKVLVSKANLENDYLYVLVYDSNSNRILYETITLVKPDIEINSYQDTSSLKPQYLRVGQYSAEKGEFEYFIDETPLFSTPPPYQKSQLGGIINQNQIPLYQFSNINDMIFALYSVLNIKNIFILNPIPSLMRDYSPLSKELKNDASNIAGFIAALPRYQREKLDNTILNYIKHLPEGDIQKIWAEPVGRLGSDAMLYCEESWNPNEPPTLVDARGMSDGTLRFLAIVTAMLTRPEGSQIVIEEVDNGLHPSRVCLLLKMLREIGQERKIDVLVTTHNPALLDQLDPNFIPFVMVVHRDPETGDSTITPLDEIENLPKLMASGTLGKITTQGLIEESLEKMK